MRVQYIEHIFIIAGRGDCSRYVCIDSISGDPLDLSLIQLPLQGALSQQMDDVRPARLTCNSVPVPPQPVTWAHEPTVDALDADRRVRLLLQAEVI